MTHWTARRVPPLILSVALLGAWGISASQAPAGLRPGGTVVVEGVQVSAPSRWRPERVSLSRVDVQVIPPSRFPAPLPSGVTLATPVYRVQARPAVQTVDASRFEIRLPVTGGALVPLRLSPDTADRAPGASLPPKAMWVSDSQARVQGGVTGFQTTTLSPEPQYFAVIRVAA